jgi:hypothetical protein
MFLGKTLPLLFPSLKKEEHDILDIRREPCGAKGNHSRPPPNPLASSATRRDKGELLAL